jgi:hypothetical protein
MSDREEFEPTAEEKRVSELIRSLPRSDADTGFRDRLKADFVAGRLGESTDPAPQPTRRGRGWIRVLIPAAAAFVMAFIIVFNAGPKLELSDITGDGTVTVDGQVFQATDRDGIVGAIKPGALVTLSEGVDIDLVYAETAVFQLSSATATIPGTPGRWFGKSTEARVEMGEMRILTGPGFRGGSLSVTSPEGEIVITGTLVSVFRDGAVTCVCVHEGTASVGINADDMQDIPAGQRKVMFADGSPPKITPIAPPHMDHLVEFEAKYRSGIRSAQ